MIFHYFLTELDSDSHSSSDTRFVVQIVTCEVQISLAFVIHEVFVQIMVQSVEHSFFCSNFGTWLNQTSRPIMYTKALLSKFKPVPDLFRYQLPDFLRNFFLNLIMIQLNVFSTLNTELFGILFCEFLTHLNNSNVSLVGWIFLLMETNESELMIFEQNAVWGIFGFEHSLVEFENG